MVVDGEQRVATLVSTFNAVATETDHGYLVQKLDVVQVLLGIVTTFQVVVGQDRRTDVEHNHVTERLAR